MLVLCGKSASGKNYMLNNLINLGMNRVVTYTTRPMREGEKEGEDYHFIPDSVFEKLKNDNFFAETTEYYVASGDVWKYGSSITDYLKNKDSVIILNPEGIKKIKEKNIDVTIFYLDASYNTRKYRLKIRGDDENEVMRRIAADDEDFKHINLIADFVIFTDQGVDPEYLAKKVYKLYKEKSDEIL